MHQTRDFDHVSCRPYTCKSSRRKERVQDVRKRREKIGRTAPTIPLWGRGLIHIKLGNANDNIGITVDDAEGRDRPEEPQAYDVPGDAMAAQPRDSGC